MSAPQCFPVCRAAAQRSRGFTLVELLIVLVLLSLVMLALGSALRTAAQTEERVDMRMQRMDDLRIANGFLRAVLGRVSAQKMAAAVEVGASPFFFRGGPSEMSWVGVMPARYGAGGRYHFRLAVADGQGLILQYLPWADVSTLPDWSLAQSHPLLPQATAIALQYESAAGEPPEWSPQWSLVDPLPDRVQISVQTVSGPWPDMVIAMRVLPASDPRSGGPVFGGGGR